MSFAWTAASSWDINPHAWTNSNRKSSHPSIYPSIHRKNEWNWIDSHTFYEKSKEDPGKFLVATNNPPLPYQAEETLLHRQRQKKLAGKEEDLYKTRQAGRQAINCPNPERLWKKWPCFLISCQEPFGLIHALYTYLTIEYYIDGWCGFLGFSTSAKCTALQAFWVQLYHICQKCRWYLTNFSYNNCTARARRWST